MTLGWHLGKTNGIAYYFKEGGGGGFHSEMRIYPSRVEFILFQISHQVLKKLCIWATKYAHKKRPLLQESASHFSVL